MSLPEVGVPPLTAANQRIRDTAKWLIASAAGVGAALIAGSQLSNIGRLDAGTVRFWVAAAGILLGLTGVVLAIGAAMRVLLPAQVLISDLSRNWEHPTPELRPVVAFFRRDTKFLQGTASPAELIKRRDSLLAKLRETNPADDLRPRIEALDKRITAVEDMANHEALKATFERALRRLMVATVIAGAGIVAFAWAANPPTSPPASPDLSNASLADARLRDADLRGVKLDGADLSRADLTGADLSGASLIKVTWSQTVCPDGTVSDANGGTCQGHLKP
jgi:pentapeptide repeat protein